MIWYLFNIFILTFLWLFLNSKSITVKLSKQHTLEKKGIFCIIATINWIILSGLRHISIGADTMAYKSMFKSVENMSWKYIFEQIYLNLTRGYADKDPGYALIEKLFQYISTNYQVWLFFVAIIFFVALAFFVYKESYNPYISYILFSTLFYAFFAITGIRQTIATSLVVFIGYKYIKKRRLIPFLFLNIISYSIHASSICFLPFYWLYKIKINKKSLLLYWLLISTSFIFRNNLLAFFKSIIGYENYSLIDGAGAGVFIYLLLFIAIIVTIFYKKILLTNYEIMNTSINALMISCIFSSLLLINPAMMRVVQYYSLFLMILLPNICFIFTNKEEHLILNYTLIILLVLLLVKNKPDYLFFWQ